MKSETKDHLNVLGRKSRKISELGRPFQPSYPKGGDHFGSRQGASSSETTIRNSKQRNVKQGAVENISRAKFSRPFPTPQKLVSRVAVPSTLQSCDGASQRYSESLVRPYYRVEPFGPHFAEFRCEIPYHSPRMVPAAQNGVYTNRSFCNPYDIPQPWETRVDYRQLTPPRTARGQWMNGLLNCSICGCNHHGSNRCAIAACWRCCRRVRMGECNVHR